MTRLGLPFETTLVQLGTRQLASSRRLRTQHHDLLLLGLRLRHLANDTEATASVSLLTLRIRHLTRRVVLARRVLQTHCAAVVRPILV